MSSIEVECAVCGRWFKHESDSGAEKLKKEHMASDHPDYIFRPNWGWVRKKVVKR